MLFKFEVEFHQTEQPTASIGKVTLRLWRHVRVMVS